MKKNGKTDRQKSEERIKNSIIEIEEAERKWKEAQKAYLEAEKQLFWAQNSLMAESLDHFFKFKQHT